MKEFSKEIKCKNLVYGKVFDKHWGARYLVNYSFSTCKSMYDSTISIPHRYT
jgi:hypothetical protein